MRKKSILNVQIQNRFKRLIQHINVVFGVKLKNGPFNLMHNGLNTVFGHLCRLIEDIFHSLPLDWVACSNMIDWTKRWDGLRNFRMTEREKLALLLENG
ncbi:hypothetical protein BK133_18645 [Paenibacillus sp. FSL H8-0548]|nr:hypothetical protein BK133_18645 [Paenibacillus sp. FSL H8-0548]